MEQKRNEISDEIIQTKAFTVDDDEEYIRRRYASELKISPYEIDVEYKTPIKFHVPTPEEWLHKDNKSKPIKTIKFNLICDGNQVRTIEDLQNNFCIEDVLSYYSNGLLHRWLNVRGYKAALEKVSEICSNDPMEIIEKLIYIFNIPVDEEKVKESVYILKYLDERKERYSTYQQENYNVRNIIVDYQNGYYDRYIEILENPNNIALIKANISEIASSYPWLFKISDVYLFTDLIKRNSWLAIMCLLMNERTRSRFLPIKKIGKDGKTYLDTEEIGCKESMFELICQKIKQSDFIDILGEHLVTVSGMADGYWHELEPKGKKCMIIRMDSGDSIRSVGCSEKELSSTDTYNNFVILDGIEYKCNTSTHKLLYMEV